MAAKASPDGFGIDINTGEPADMLKKGVLDPALVKTTALQAAGLTATRVTFEGGHRLDDVTLARLANERTE